MAIPDDNPITEEVRLAMAWNGGVSLAVWMGGAAVEFDCARRAHAGDDDAGDDEEHIPRSLYTALTKAFDRRLVVDILAGASAGGINGGLMAAAIRHNRRLHPNFVREKWLEFGDFGSLLQPSSAKKPSSILQGRVFYEGLLGVFEELQSPARDSPVRLSASQETKLVAGDAVLDVQVTTVEGEAHTFVDEWGDELVALEYRTPVRFRRPADFDDPDALACAARASASFPVAFEPQEIAGRAAELAGLPGERRWAIDGGLLENAPIRQALALIPLRPASGPVRRFVCYVNASPQTAPTRVRDEPAPDLRAVLGYVVNLPRDGRAIDQLTAIDDAIRAAGAAGDTQEMLLSMPSMRLEPAADGLLPAYQWRRSALSLEELLGDAKRRDVGLILRRLLAANRQLPWIPAGPLVTADLDNWRWGIRAAQRILFLELDVLRKCVSDRLEAQAITEAELVPICAARGEISARIAELEVAHEAFTQHADGGTCPGSTAAVTRDLARAGLSSAAISAKLEALDALMDEHRPTIRAALTGATTSFYDALRLVDPAKATELFGLAGDNLVSGALASRAPLDHFLIRALRVEVVRRALVADRDIDAAQPLLFAQLTPRVACPLFTSRPLTQRGPDDGEKKLTGIRLGHFAGFYRKSWRANDFLWGRLDAATRIVDLLVDQERGAFLARLGRESPAGALAEELVPEGENPAAADRRWLVAQTLAEVAGDGSSVDVDALARTPELRQQVTNVIEADLAAVGGGQVTRVLCTRAAQYEIASQELKVVLREMEEDVGAGSSRKALGFTITAEGGLRPAIEELQNPGEDLTLPKRLGRDSAHEATSTLAMRTISHTALVALAALPGLSMPMARAVLPARVPFLAISGISARGVLEQLAVALAFGASSLFLAVRLLSAIQEHDPDQTAELASIGSPAVWVMWIAALVVAAFVFVPAWRARNLIAEPLRAGRQVGIALALLACGGIVPIVGAVFVIGVPKTIVATGGFTPNGWLVASVLVIAGSLALAARWIGRLGKPVLNVLDSLLRQSHATAVLAIVVSIALIGDLVFEFDDLDFTDVPWWHKLSLVLACLSSGVGMLYVFGQHPRVRAAAARSKQLMR